VVTPDPEAQYSVQSIDGPIFDEEGNVTLALGLTNLPLLCGRRIVELAQHVRAAAAEVNSQ
jgi:DNA-binding IclR family transcriptional regulator